MLNGYRLKAKKLAYNNIVRKFFILSFSLKSIEKVLLTICLSLIVSISALSAYLLYQTKFAYPIHYKEQVFKYADLYGLDRALVFAMIKTESGFDKNAVSGAGAVGLMQITPKTAKFIANVLGEHDYSLTDAQTNVRFGCYYVRYLLNKFNVLDTALVAYNAGEGNVIKWLKDKEFSSDEKVLNCIPFKESREYIKKIKQNTKKYNKLYNKILDK